MPKPCLHCQERIADNATVCPRCGAFDPFAAPLSPPPPAPDDSPLADPPGDDGRTASPPETKRQLEPPKPRLPGTRHYQRTAAQPSGAFTRHYERKGAQLSGAWRASDSVRPVSLPPLEEAPESNEIRTWPWLAFLFLIIPSQYTSSERNEIYFQENILGTGFENAVVPIRWGIFLVVILSAFVGLCGAQ